MDQSEDREEGAPPWKTTYTPPTGPGPGPGPGPSCVSMKSDDSMHRWIQFKTRRVPQTQVEQQSSEVPTGLQHQTQLDSIFKETQMRRLREGLLDVLENLVDDEFKEFKWFLTNEKPTIPRSRLEKADRMDTVDLMVQTYCTDTAKVTVMVLEKMNKTDLEKTLSKNIPVSADNVSESESQLSTPSQNIPPERKLLLARRKLVESVSVPVLSQLVDCLLEKGIINDEEMESVKTKSRADGARDVIDMTRKKGAAACLISAIHECDEYLYRKLSTSWN